jgi:capsular exopolysaccharide synthesis family protein
MQHTKSSNSLIQLQDVYHLFNEKKWLIASCVAIVFSMAVAYILISPNIYASRSVIQVEQRSQKVVNIQEVNQDDLEAMDIMKTIEQSLVTDELLLRVIKKNNLANNPDFLPHRNEPYTDDQLILALSKHLKAKVRRGTRLIDVTAENKNPVLAKQIVQSLIDEYIKQNFDQRGKSSMSANGFLVQEAEKLKAKLDKSEAELQEYREKTNAVSLEDKQNIVVDTLKTLNTKLTEARAARMMLESDVAQYKALAAGDPKRLLAIPSIANSLVVLDAKRRVSDQEAEIARLKERYRPEHPKYIEAQSALAQIASDFDKTILKAGEQAGASYEAAVANEHKLEDALAEQEKVSIELNKISVPYNVLLRNVQADSALYDSTITRIKETDVTKSLESAPIKVIEQARVETKPVRPKKLLILVLGLFGGLGLGAGLCLALNAMDGSVKTVDEAEHTFHVPVISAVPQMAYGRKSGGQKMLALLHSPSSTTAEAFRSLRTALELKDITDRQVLLFTSAIPNEGKTFCSTNCAVACANYGYRTLIVDADLRRPSVAKILDQNASYSPGLADCLSGTTKVSAAIRETGIENLSILTAGSLAKNPAELMSREKLERLFKDPAFENFDRVIFDTPPLNAVSDALHLIKLSTAVCLVVRAGKTSIKASQRAYAALVSAKAPDVGIVLNGLPRHSYYHYAFEYGQKGVYGATK